MNKLLKRWGSLTLLIVLTIVIFAGFSGNILAATFTPRLTAPDVNSSYYKPPNNNFSKGQCTWYAYGRAYELLGSKPNLITFPADGKDWYSNNIKQGGYAYNSDYTKPQLGAIVCYGATSNNSYGHVAVVEKIVGTQITISEYNYSKALSFGTRTISTTTKPAAFQGYIYIVNSAPDTTKPVITNVKVSNIDSTGYTVTCTVTDNIGVTRVAFPTWTEANGQDDLLWKDGTISGSTASFRVLASDHKYESGNYITHIYAYDATGNYSSAGTTCILNIATTPTETWKITATAGVNMRGGPGTTYSIVGAIPFNAVISVSEKVASGGYTWGKTTYGGKTGWVALDFASQIVSEKWKITATAGVNIRSGAGTTYSNIGAVPYNTTVTVTEKVVSGGYTWGKITYGGKTGWIALDFAVRV